ncbi:hypothetical protein ACWEQN_47625 [Streptomyces sp. NPDC004129]
MATGARIGRTRLRLATALDYLARAISLSVHVDDLLARPRTLPHPDDVAGAASA